MTPMVIFIQCWSTMIIQFQVSIIPEPYAIPKVLQIML